MAAKSAGRRAGRVEQDRVEGARRRPFQRVGSDQLRLEPGARQIFGQSCQTTFRTVDRSHAMTGGGQLHGLAARRGAKVEDVRGLEWDQARRKRSSQVLDPEGAVVEARQLRDITGMLNPPMPQRQLPTDGQLLRLLVIRK